METTKLDEINACFPRWSKGIEQWQAATIQGIGD
jgi:hypothetical protein